MGNTLVQDVTTGSLMELSPGFVPIGMKEYGGILYIASVNKDGVGELGSIPSPIITWNREDTTYISANAEDLVTEQGGPVESLVRISDRLKTGNKFLIELNLEGTNIVRDEYTYYDSRTYNAWQSEYCYVDLITSPWKKIDHDGVLKKGIYEIQLYSIGDANTQRLDSVESSPQEYYWESSDLQISPYWFVRSEVDKTIDLTRVFEDKSILKSYPKTGSGYLAIRAKLENIEAFKCLPRNQEQDEFLPVTTITEYGLYRSSFLGFKVETQSGIYVSKLSVTVFNETAQINMPIYGMYEDTLVKATSPTINFELQEQYEQSDFLGVRVSELPAEGSDGTMISYLMSSAVKAAYDSDYYAKSSNFVDDKAVVTHPLFYIENTVQDVWYTATVKYYDQFGNQLGTYTMTFNPYVNDVLENIYNANATAQMASQSNSTQTASFSIDVGEAAFSGDTDVPSVWLDSMRKITGDIAKQNVVSKTKTITATSTAVVFPQSTDYLGKFTPTLTDKTISLPVKSVTFAGLIQNSAGTSYFICQDKEIVKSLQRMRYHVKTKKTKYDYSKDGIGMTGNGLAELRKADPLYTPASPYAVQYGGSDNTPPEAAVDLSYYRGIVRLNDPAEQFCVFTSYSEALNQANAFDAKLSETTSGKLQVSFTCTYKVETIDDGVLVVMTGDGPTNTTTYNSRTYFQPKIIFGSKIFTNTFDGSANSYQIASQYTWTCTQNTATGQKTVKLAGVNYGKSGLARKDELTLSLRNYIEATNLVFAGTTPQNYWKLDGTAITVTSSSFSELSYISYEENAELNSNTLEEGVYVLIAYFSGNIDDITTDVIDNHITSGIPQVFNVTTSSTITLKTLTNTKIYSFGLFKVQTKSAKQVQGSKSITQYKDIILPFVESYYENQTYGSETFTNNVGTSTDVIVIPNNPWEVNHIYVEQENTWYPAYYTWDSTHRTAKTIDNCFTTVSGKHIQTLQS